MEEKQKKIYFRDKQRSGEILSLGICNLKIVLCCFINSKGDVGNAILDTKGKIILAFFSVCNKQPGVS